jgi:hypothetical protein
MTMIRPERLAELRAQRDAEAHRIRLMQARVEAARAAGMRLAAETMTYGQIQALAGPKGHPRDLGQRLAELVRLVPGAAALALATHEECDAFERGVSTVHGAL